MATRKKNDEEIIEGEIVSSDDTNLVDQMLYGDFSYEQVVTSGEVDKIPGWLVFNDKGEDGAHSKKELMGVPFAAIRATFRYSGRAAEYVSLYAVAAGLGKIVINDGSTGIRRQVVDYLILKGIIKALPDTKVTGDSPMSDFDFGDGVDVKFGQLEGEMTVDVVFPRPLDTPHGLRRSDYDYEDPTTGEKSKAHTYYLG